MLLQLNTCIIKILLNTPCSIAGGLSSLFINQSTQHSCITQLAQLFVCGSLIMYSRPSKFWHCFHFYIAAKRTWLTVHNISYSCYIVYIWQCKKIQTALFCTVSQESFGSAFNSESSAKTFLGDCTFQKNPANFRYITNSVNGIIK